MTIHSSPFPDITVTDQSITERVFSGLLNRPDEVVLIDGLTGQSLTAAAFMDQVKRLAKRNRGNLTCQPQTKSDDPAHNNNTPGACFQLTLPTRS